MFRVIFEIGEPPGYLFLNSGSVCIHMTVFFPENVLLYLV